ncbi:site-specific integrase [Geodermatophilus sp. DSM 45219]|uniref:tyrosine-type recombinase/integrase n=1 Tax=Geodermatophilus sp. DSM 45219 TaxID=1881103 RepID=UPI00088A58EA|nr:site-specific integrase [Geodermatophilus sp. DSM 45219]SDN38795.1 Site-specific recombinase XerD [Geodermatophilus sp. DSM 45219]
MAGRAVNGEGSVYRRKDGRYEAAIHLHTASGSRKRVRVYGKTRAEARAQLITLAAQGDQGMPVPDRTWRLGDYLDHWLATVVRPNCRPRTYESYEAIIRLHLKPALGRQPLGRLGVAVLQTFFNDQAADGQSTRLLAATRSVLRASLTQAQREELIVRNPARLVKLPSWRPKEVRPWTPEEAGQFLRAATDDPLYPAFVLLLLYGLRRGEVVGLRWQDVDAAHATLHVRQQIQRLDGQLQQVPVKTEAGKRDLPLLPLAERVIGQQAAGLTAAPAPDALVFTTRFGQPIEPHNLARSFQRIREAAGLPRIRLHDLRHTTATLLKRLGVPVRDAQLVLGHASPLTTQQIYQHASPEDQRTALSGVERLLTAVFDGSRCRQLLPSSHSLVASNTTFQSGGPSGARTHDTLLKRSRQPLNDDPLTEALELVRVCTRQRLVGHVAVRTAVSFTPRPRQLVTSARYWLGLLNSPSGDRS